MADSDVRKALKRIDAGDLEGLRKLLALGTADVDCVVGGQLPLVQAADVDDAMVLLLLDAGADVNGRDGSGDTALIKACEHRSILRVKLLLNRGADPNLQKDSVVVPLRRAAGTRSTASVEIARLLLSAGANPNFVSVSKHGVPVASLLMVAAKAGNREVVRLLLDAGARVNDVHSFGTSLTEAAEGGDVETARMLLEAGADRQLRVPATPANSESGGKSALEIARSKQARAVVALLDGGAPVVHATPIDIRAAWRRLEEALSVRRPSVLRQLRPGASQRQISTFEKAIGRSLPDEARGFFMVHDGQSEHADTFIGESGEFLSPPAHRMVLLDESLRMWEMWASLVRAGEFAGRPGLPDKGVREDWYHLGWIPLTDNGAGNHYCLDLVPAEGGRAGQVILVRHDAAARPIAAGGLAQWLQDLAQQAEGQGDSQ